MGQLKQWYAAEHECVVCGKMFMPFQVNHEMDIGAPTCSWECWACITGAPAPDDYEER